MAGAAIVLGAAGALAPSAFADTGSRPSTTTSTSGTLAAIQARAASAISTRLSALQTATSDVNSNKYLTSADRARLSTNLDSDVAALKALAPVIRADTTVAQATADYRTIFTRYRVFALVLPQVRMATASDRLTATVLPRLTHAQSRLQALLAGRDSGKNTGAVQAAMADLGTRISALTSATSGLAGTVLAFTPAQWDANHALLSPPRSQLAAARADARTAAHDVRTVVTAIR